MSVTVSMVVSVVVVVMARESHLFPLLQQTTLFLDLVMCESLGTSPCRPIRETIRDSSTKNVIDHGAFLFVIISV